MEATEPTPEEQGSPLAGEASEYPRVSPTGDAAVDDVLQSLSSVRTADDAAQHALYERLHDELLAELNTEQG